MATRPHQFTLDKSRLVDELRAFEKLLAGDARELSERNEILPFFKSHLNLASLIGYHHSKAFPANILKAELGLFGDFACDMIVGNRDTGQYCFIEFENAAEDSLFRKDGRWSSRLEHGLSQIADWFYLLTGNRNTPQFRSFFHTDLADYSAVLIIGRDRYLSETQRHRLRWRSQNTMLAGKHVLIVTFDELFESLRINVEVLISPATHAVPTRRTRKT